MPNYLFDGERWEQRSVVLYRCVQDFVNVLDWWAAANQPDLPIRAILGRLRSLGYDPVKLAGRLPAMQRALDDPDFEPFEAAAYQPVARPVRQRPYNDPFEAVEEPAAAPERPAEPVGRTTRAREQEFGRKRGLLSRTTRPSQTSEGRHERYIKKVAREKGISIEEARQRVRRNVPRKP